MGERLITVTIVVSISLIVVSSFFLGLCLGSYL